MSTNRLHTISVVIPVYRGEQVIGGLVSEIDSLFLREKSELLTKAGARYEIKEVVLVNDCGPDNSAEVIRKLEQEHTKVRCIWLSRNFGQHAATMAGMASTQSDWIVTLDEDGQQNPAYIPDLLDVALQSKSKIVYASPTNKPPHGMWRNLASRFVKWVARTFLTSPDFERFNSYRLILGEAGRVVAAYGGNGVYLDAALTWVAGSAATCDVELRSEGRSSGYSLSALVSHFGRLIISSGARPLRVIALLGAAVASIGFGLSFYLMWMRLTHGVTAVGWTSVIVAVLITSGLTMLSLGVISEFLGSLVRLSMGKPLYVVVDDPHNGPLGNSTAS